MCKQRHFRSPPPSAVLRAPRTDDPALFSFNPQRTPFPQPFSSGEGGDHTAAAFAASTPRRGMGINDLLPRLPGGNRYIHSLLELGIAGSKVPLDAAGALYQFASLNAPDFLRGNHTPSLVMWARYLNY